MTIIKKGAKYHLKMISPMDMAAKIILISFPFHESDCIFKLNMGISATSRIHSNNMVV